MVPLSKKSAAVHKRKVDLRFEYNAALFT